MKTDIKRRGALRLSPCHYGLSKLPFRAPQRPTDGRFIAFLGGSDTFAKYIRKPFPDLVETAIGEVCVNLGCQSAGPDVFLQDRAIETLCHDASAIVIQVLGAANQSNGFYRVHPRRNDRFIAPTDKLTALFPEVDFAEIAFTGHLVARLKSVDAVRFEFVKQHLQRTWLRRMTRLIGQSVGPVVLLWLTRSTGAAEDARRLPETAFVTPAMVDALRSYVFDIVEVEGETGPSDDMCFAPLDALNMDEVLQPSAHERAARRLRPSLLTCLR